MGIDSCGVLWMELTLWLLLRGVPKWDIEEALSFMSLKLGVSRKINSSS